MGRYGKLWENVEMYGKVYVGYGKVKVRYRKVWEVIGNYGKI